MLCANSVHIGIMYLFQPSWPSSDKSGFAIALHFILALLHVICWKYRNASTSLYFPPFFQHFFQVSPNFRGVQVVLLDFGAK